MWKTGHSHLKRKMREDKILLGGEVSGHMFFAENYYGVDDGILALVQDHRDGRARRRDRVSRLFDSVPHLRATPELKAPCPDGEKFRVVEEVTRELKRRYETIDIDGARVLFPGRGWGLVRASNTNPYLTLRFEAQTRGRDRGDEARHLRRAPPLPLRYPAWIVTWGAQKWPPNPPRRSGRPGEAVAPLDYPRCLGRLGKSRGTPRFPAALAALRQKPWHASIPRGACGASAKAVARLDYPRWLGRLGKSRGTPRVPAALGALRPKPRCLTGAGRGRCRRGAFSGGRRVRG